MAQGAVSLGKGGNVDRDAPGNGQMSGSSYIEGDMKTFVRFSLYSLTVLALVFSATGAAAAPGKHVLRSGNTFTVVPTGVDDTVNLQNAFNLALAAFPLSSLQEGTRSRPISPEITSRTNLPLGAELSISASLGRGNTGRFPLVVDLFIQQAKLLATDGAAWNMFGISAALSADGNTALVVMSNRRSSKVWSAYIFVRSGTTWSQEAKLLASDGAVGESFGASVALSSDGNTALVGSDDSAYAFVRSRTTWSQQAQLLGADGAAVGASVALSADGNTALLGAPGDTVGGNSGQGSAYIFIRSGTTWSQQAKLLASDGAVGERFGASVALSADGNTALVGAYATFPGTQGSVYALVRSGTTWSQQAKLLASDGAVQDQFGCSLALSDDGNTALVGAYKIIIGSNTDQGAAYAFVRSGTTWSQQAKVLASDGAAGDYFGLSVSLSADGNIALVGAPDDTADSNTMQGSAYFFVRSGTTWSQQAKLLASDGAAWDQFGYASAMSADGHTALVGAYYDTVGGNEGQGSAYIFHLWQPTIFLPMVMRN